MSDRIVTLLDAIAARADEANDGPWGVGDTSTYGLSSVIIPEAMHPTAWPADAEFIAAARTDVPEMVATLRAVLGLLAEYEKDDSEHVRDFGQHHPYAGWAADHLRAALGEDT